MRILMLNGSDQKMGAPKSLLGLCVEWKKKGVDTIVLTQNNGVLNEKLNTMGIHNFVIPYRNIMTKNNFVIVRYLREVVFNIFSVVKFAFVNREKFDVVYSGSSVFRFGAIIAQIYRVPHIWHIREFGYEDYNLSPLITDYYEYMNKHANLIISVSNAVKDSWVKRGININKIKTVYNGINPEYIRYEKHPRTKQIKMVFCGTLMEAKGQYQIIEALGQLPKDISQNFIIDFWGSHDNEAYYTKLKSRVNHYQLKNVNFKGYTDNIYSLLPNYDIGINCSRCEGFGRVTIEYMLAGLCVIASNTGANSELIKDNYDGIIYNYNDIGDLKLKLLFIYNNSKECDLYRERGRIKAAEQFTSEKNADEILKLIKKLRNN